MRYVVSLQDEKDKTCYKDLEEFDVFENAKLKAQELSDKFNRSTIIWDKKTSFITERIVKEQKTEEKAEQKITMSRRIPSIKRK